MIFNDERSQLLQISDFDVCLNRVFISIFICGVHLRFIASLMPTIWGHEAEVHSAIMERARISNYISK